MELLQEASEWAKTTVEVAIGLRLIDYNNYNLLTCLVRALLPNEPRLHPTQRAKIEQEVVDFVATQITTMPSFLRIPYQIALQGFNWLAVFRYGCWYTRLDANRQQRYTLAWSNSRIRMIRDFVKLIRSCVLLYYLDHPLVTAQLELDQVRSGHGK